MGFQSKSKSLIEAIKSMSKNLLFPSSVPPGILLRQSDRRIGIDRGIPGKPASIPREEIFELGISFLVFAPILYCGRRNAAAYVSSQIKTS